VILFVFEFLGTTELIVILAAALVLFGPRRLPELGRTLGKSLAEFKRATDDFKRTWEREVEVDKLEREMRIEHAINDPIPPALPEVGDELSGDEQHRAGDAGSAADDSNVEERTIARRTPSALSGDASSDDSSKRAPTDAPTTTAASSDEGATENLDERK
jgi:sec-independent protein translocase protein TatA